MISYYEVLGVKPNASSLDIKTAYHKMISLHHPDKHGDYSDPITRLIIDAYAVLSNATKRRNYNEELILRQPGATKDHPKKPNESHLESTQGSQRCHDCDGYGYTPTLGVSWTCRTCKGKGWLPGKKVRPSVNYDLCRDCKGYGYDYTLGIAWNCRTCAGIGWVPSRKF